MKLFCPVFRGGMSVVLAVTMALAPLNVTARTVSASATIEDPICAQIPQVPVEAQEFAQTLCTVESELFGGGNAPSTGYVCPELPTKAGTYSLTDCYQREISLEVVSAVHVPLRKLRPSQFAEGDEASMVWGWIKGSVGKSAVVMMAVHKPSLTNDATGSFVMVTKVITDAELEERAVMERVLAGARVVDAHTGQSRSLRQLAGSVTVSGDPSDLSTLYSLDPTSGTGDSSVDCLSLAYARHAASVKGAGANLAICLVDAVGEYAICAGLCLVPLMVPGPLGLGVFLACEAGCLINYYRKQGICEAYYETALNAANTTLMLDLLACGAHFAHT